MYKYSDHHLNAFMKHFPQRIILIAFLTTVLFFLPYWLSADPVDPCVDPDLYCPIDTWLYVLLAIGILYGIKKGRDAKRKAPQP